MRFNGKNMNSTPTFFFTADEHYGHSNIIRYCERPFLLTITVNTGLANRVIYYVYPNANLLVIPSKIVDKNKEA